MQFTCGQFLCCDLRNAARRILQMWLLLLLSPVSIALSPLAEIFSVAPYISSSECVTCLVHICTTIARGIHSKFSLEFGTFIYFPAIVLVYQTNSRSRDDVHSNSMDARNRWYMLVIIYELRHFETQNKVKQWWSISFIFANQLTYVLWTQIYQSVRPGVRVAAHKHHIVLYTLHVIIWTWSVTWSSGIASHHTFEWFVEDRKLAEFALNDYFQRSYFLAPWHSHDDDLLNDRDQAAKSERWSPLTVVTVEDNRWPWHLDLCAYDLTSP